MTTPAMKPEDAERVLEVVAGAQACTPDRREAFVVQACAADAVMRAEVESLLRFEVGAHDFLETPAFKRSAELFAEAIHGELKAGDTLGDCRIVSLLGVGGMGEVYLAEDTALGRRVALKLIQHGRGGALLRHFRHERRVLASLSHPHIARLYGGAVSSEGRAYLVMEYIEGQQLDEYCNRRQLGVAERLALFRKVCSAVAYAHQNLVIHRDLKPANIRVTAEGEPKLLDFGIAKLLEAESLPDLEPTLTMQAIMTPEYASPEQLRGEAITTASDVYSLGVILYELLSGQRPYRLNSRRPAEAARVVCEQEPERPSTVVGRTKGTNAALRQDLSTEKLRRRLVGDLDNIVAMAMRKEPARRYGSVSQFSEDIRRPLDGLPVIARKDTLGYRTGKFIRRNKTAMSAAAFVALALVGGLVTTTWQARVARQERDRARLSQQQAERLNTFLQNLLSSADPAKLGKDVKVVQVLDVAGKSIDAELASEPELLAQAHQTLSRAYLRLGVIIAAETHARAAVDLFRRLHGDDDLTTARAKIYLVDALLKRNHYAEMATLSEQALVVLRREPVPDNYDLALALTLRGTSLTYTMRPNEAGPVLNEALTRMRAARGEMNTEYLNIMRGLSVLKLLQGDFAGSEAVSRRIIETADKIAPGSTETLATQFNLCIVFFVQGRLDEMDATLRRLEPECRQKVGENNRFFGLAQSMASVLDFVRGDDAKVVAEGQQALDIMAALFPGTDYHIVLDRTLLGLSLTRTGKATAGEGLLRTALADSRNMDPYSRAVAPRFFDRTFGNVETALGECLLAQKRYAEAEPLLLSGYRDLKTRLGEHHPLCISAERRLQDFYTVWNKPDEIMRIRPSSG